MNLYDRIIELIKKYDKISLFFHQNPDYDCLGSVFAFQSFLKQKYPKKIVMIIGIETLTDEVLLNFPSIKANGSAKDTWINKSLGIVCDTSNRERINDQRYMLCEKIIKIDHHPKVDDYGYLSFVNEKASSCCEILFDLFYYWSKKNIKLNVAKYLYVGILTDTNRFAYPNTTTQTLDVAIKLFDILGDERIKINQKLYSRTLNDVAFFAEVQTLVKYDQKNNLAWLIIPNSLFKKYKKEPQSCVGCMSNIKDINVWASLYYDEKANSWKGSIRSNSIDISKVAKKYNGGGHKLASGFSIPKESQFNKVLIDLKKL